MDATRRQRLQEFVAWTRQHITGDEKGQAQIFLDRLFIAFGQKGSLDVGGAPEFRIKKASEDGGGTSFADYVWKPVVLIEMKKRGVDLSRHYRQAFDYWTRLVPNRPRYVVLCSFDQFHIYDFDRQIDSPVDTVALAELPERWGPLAFLFPTQEAPQFANDREAVTREAADNLARCFNLLTDAKRHGGPVPRDLAQRFILQMLVSLFAEDIDLLPKYIVARLLDEVKSPADSFDILGGLFEAMNRKEGNAGGRYKGVDYFNGGLFAAPAKVELNDAELAQLKAAAKSNWSKVSPDIFGTLFEHSLGKEARHAFGAHYTSPIDIMKIVRPTIIDPWTAAIESAKTLKELRTLRERLQNLRVLDPACGSGNFLYMAYRELKRLEARIIERMNEFKSADKTQGELGFVTARQFFGMDINPFAIELAKVTMMIARKLAIDELHITEAALPLDNLDDNFKCVDALIQNPTCACGAATPCPCGKPPDYTRASQTAWPTADVIIGNPPFLGAKGLKPERGADYVKTVRTLYPDVPGMADYCVYWIRRSHDHLPTCSPDDLFRGRAGLVGTQNIRNNQSRVGGLDHVVSTGTIVEAVENQRWSGEAKVHVSIVNWVRSQDVAVVPKLKLIWSKIEQPKTKKTPVKRGTLAGKTVELRSRTCNFINAALSDETDVTHANVLTCNVEPKYVFQGITPGHKGFVLSHKERDRLVRDDPASSPVIFPYLIGRELVNGDGTPERWIIDFQQRNVVEARAFPKAFARVESTVLGTRQEKAEQKRDANGNMRPHHKRFLERWWKLAWDRADMLQEFAKLKGRFIGLTRNTTYPVYCFVSTTVRPSDVVQAFCFDDDYSFGTLQAIPHYVWLNRKGSNRGTGPRYTPESVFNTFPWPQGPEFTGPSKKQINAVAQAGREVRRVREEALKVIKGGLRAVYRTLELPGKHPLKDAHATLDAAVLDAYGFSAKKDLLKQVLDLNHTVAAREKNSDPVTAPGVPPSYGDTAPLITEDCIRTAL